MGFCNSDGAMYSQMIDELMRETLDERQFMKNLLSVKTAYETEGRVV